MVLAGVALALGAGIGPRAVAATGSGFGTPWLAETGGPEVLQTQTLLLPDEGSRPFADRFQFELGFSTTEVAATGSFYDSLTLSLSRPDGSGSIILATADAFGLTLPPGGVTELIPGSSVRVTEIGFRGEPLPGAASTFAYSLEVELPLAARSAGYRATFDLFSNGDLVNSRGYAMAIPEPEVVALFSLGVGLLCWWSRKGRRA